MQREHSARTVRPVIEISIPAAGEYVGTLRTAAASLAANANFNIDDIDDLRIAVDEACSTLVTRAIPGTALYCRYFSDGDAITIEARAHVLDKEPPARSSFSWMVMTSVTTSVDVTVEGADELVIVLTRIATKALEPQ